MSILHPSLFRTFLAAAACAVAGLSAARAATESTAPVGYQTISLLDNSDTYVSVPFHRPAVYHGQVASISGNVITVSGTPGWTSSQFVYAAGTQPNTYYVLVRNGAKEGNYYTVTANGSNTLMLDPAGDNLATIGTQTTIAVIPYWTIATLFPPSDAGTSFTPSTLASINTSILIPNIHGVGINLASSATYFYFNNAWRKIGLSFAIDKGDDILLPDTYFIVRNTNAAQTGTFTTYGRVLTGKAAMVLTTRPDRAQDNPVALARPVPVTLAESNLIGSGAFAVTTNWVMPTDLLLVFDNTTRVINKSATGTYYYFNNGWRKIGHPPTADFSNDAVFSANYGVIIRKAATGTGSSATWANAPTY